MTAALPRICSQCGDGASEQGILHAQRQHWWTLMTSRQPTHSVQHDQITSNVLKLPVQSWRSSVGAWRSAVMS
jgi:hypothetical protein